MISLNRFYKDESELLITFLICMMSNKLYKSSIFFLVLRLTLLYHVKRRIRLKILELPFFSLFSPNRGHLVGILTPVMLLPN